MGVSLEEHSSWVGINKPARLEGVGIRKRDRSPATVTWNCHCALEDTCLDALEIDRNRFRVR